MRSAYMVLGIPGDATIEEIETAFVRARGHYTPERLANADGAVDKFNELKAAYDILRKPDARAAHDRKLASMQRPLARLRPALVAEEVPASRSLMKYGLILVALLFCGGYFVSYKNAEARRLQAAVELEAKQQEVKDKELARIDAERADRERTAAKAKADADEARFAAEGRAAGARATYERTRQEAAAGQMQRAAVAEAQRQDYLRLAEDRRNAMEAQRRVEADKRRIRELCLAQYRRPDC
ncbi:MAG: DnaJ domain-containing protein [Pseudomonadota bacterium]